jgi:mono/diheme cytochrome c family protein
MAVRMRRVFGWILGGALGLVLVAATAVYLVSERRLGRRYELAAEALAVPIDAAAVARGQHLATSRLGCASCHGADLGGNVVVDDGAFGRFVAPNLTRGAGGVGSRYADADWVRALRHGVRPGGEPLLMMPSASFTNLDEADLGAVIAYVKQVPPVDRELAGTEPGPVARTLVTLKPASIMAATSIDHTARPATTAAVAPTPQYGAYIARTSGCHACHGEGLGGGKFDGPPSAPPGANLTSGGPLATWSEADFIRALREGKRPDGSAIDPFMPWQTMGRMNDEELRAVYLYLKSVPPRKTGSG